MRCPLCPDATLEPKYVGDTEVDICPRCRGIWLDRGELDRLIGDGPDRRDDRRDVRRDDRSDVRRDVRSDKPKKSKAKRLADLFEEVLDF
ncbi:MAG: zf-TFIIB domain-containing protein [Ilumatobacteraceae bacterium]